MSATNAAELNDFWKSPTLDELAELQQVRPMADARCLFGTWPGEPDDEFEASIDELRHPRATSSGNE